MAQETPKPVMGDVLILIVVGTLTEAFILVYDGAEPMTTKTLAACFFGLLAAEKLGKIAEERRWPPLAKLALFVLGIASMIGVCALALFELLG